MDQQKPLERWMAQAQGILGVSLQYHTLQKAVGPCPKCKAEGRDNGGRDRFIVFAVGNYWCHQCNYKGFWLDKDEGQKRLAEAKQQQEENQAKLKGRMGGLGQTWRGYHQAVLDSEELTELWLKEGITHAEILRWGLGFCSSCPLASEYQSLTIPVFRAGALVDIRHRMIGGVQGNKYRSHLKGLEASPFNIDCRHADKDVIILEGEKKAISFVSAGYEASIGIPGMQAWGSLIEGLGDLQPEQRIILAFDPDRGAPIAERAGAELAQELANRVAIADFPRKPDDYLRAYGRELVALILKQSRPIRIQGQGRGGRWNGIR